MKGGTLAWPEEDCWDPRRDESGLRERLAMVSYNIE